jgi:peptide methionine sulfoxide reductase MsrB
MTSTTLTWAQIFQKPTPKGSVVGKNDRANEARRVEIRCFS